MIEYRWALAGLLRSAEPPVSPALAEFVATVGAQQAWAMLIDRHAPEEVQRVVAPRLGSLDATELMDRARKDVDRAATVGAELIGPEDDVWPGECFEPLGWTRPYDACPTAAQPLALYRRGQGWPTRPRGTIAVVGSRAATPYGVRVTTQIAADAAAAGYVVASGAAYGVDAAAHRGSLAGSDDGTATIAVLASGVDKPYPTAHRALIDEISLRGAVVSEYAPGTPPARHRFLVRNRLIAAFAEATVVVEAGCRSGSLNTATTAAALGRSVLAIPGPVTSAMSAGCHQLIRHGRATLVSSWADIVADLGPLQPDVAPHRPGERPTDGLDLIAARVYEALPARGAVDVDTLCRDADLASADVLGGLAVLALRGLAGRIDGRWRRVALDADGRGRARSTV